MPSTPSVASKMSPMLKPFSRPLVSSKEVATQQVPYQAKTSFVVKTRTPPGGPEPASKISKLAPDGQIELPLSEPAVSKDAGILRRLISSPTSSPSTTFDLLRDTTVTFSPAPVRPALKFEPGKSSEGQQRIHFINSVMPSLSKSSDNSGEVGHYLTSEAE